ncbi:hypothetical protein YC2023_090851 [Brassica napus]
MEENGEVALARPISRVHCRQRYNLKLEAGKTKLGAILEMSIVEEGRGSRKGCVRTRVYLSIPVIEGRSRQVILETLTTSSHSIVHEFVTPVFFKIK